MISRTLKDFENRLLSKLSFSPFSSEDCTIYKNNDIPELGYFIKYTREGYYDFVIGDYTIPTNFSISFNHNEELIRFGTIYTGETRFEIEDNSISSFSPSSFLVTRKKTKGTQTWKKGQHFHGVEITIYKKYFDEIINPNFPKTIDFNNFINNYTYRYLPLEINSIIQVLRSMAEAQTLTPLYLESKILESIA